MKIKGTTFTALIKTGLLTTITLLTLSGCGGEAELFTVEDSQQQKDIEPRNNNQYISIQKQASIGEFKFAELSAQKFVSNYFALSLQVSSTQFMLSEVQTFDIPEHTVSFAINFDTPLAGEDLFIGELETPSGNIIDLWRLIPCFDGTCSMVIPNRADPLYQPEAGQWKYRVLAKQAAVQTNQLDDVYINMLIRTNQQLDNSVATIPVQPYYTGTKVPEAHIANIMNEFVKIFEVYDIYIDWKETIHISPTEFTNMTINFSDDKTKTLMQYGESDLVNIYFVEGFEQIHSGEETLIHPSLHAETQSLLGIAAGVPGSLGSKGDSNGVMVSLGVDGELAYIAENVANTAAHEMGHFLGLFHTSELSGIADPLEDTAHCETEDGGFSDIELCDDVDNLMFPLSREAGLLSTRLTDEQLFILKSSPLAY